MGTAARWLLPAFDDTTAAGIQRVHLSLGVYDGCTTIDDTWSQLPATATATEKQETRPRLHHADGGDTAGTSSQAGHGRTAAEQVDQRNSRARGVYRRRHAIWRRDGSSAPGPKAVRRLRIRTYGDWLVSLSTPGCPAGPVPPSMDMGVGNPPQRLPTPICWRPGPQKAMSWNSWADFLSVAW